MTEHDFRRMALACAGASESAHMGHPDFRAHGRIFATLKEDRAFGMVVLTPEQQGEFMTTSRAFAPESGAWGRAGCTRVDLAAVDDDSLGEALTLAWQNSAAKTKRPVKPGSPTRRAAKSAGRANSVAKRAKPASKKRAVRR